MSTDGSDSIPGELPEEQIMSMPGALAGDAALLPADLADVLLQLDAAERQAAALIEDLDDERINWRPGPACWSIAQCLDHLSASSRTYLAAMREGEAAARRRGWRRRGPISPGGPSRWFIRQLEPSSRTRAKAPRKIVPAQWVSKAEAGDEFARQQAQVRALLRAAADLDLNRARFVNPFVPLVRFSLGTGFLVLAAHQRRHLAQAARVRRSPDFP
jgi:DinB superfamily